MSVPVSRAAAFTIFDTKADDPEAVPFSIVLKDSQTLSLSIKRGAPLTVSV